MHISSSSKQLAFFTYQVVTKGIRCFYRLGRATNFTGDGLRHVIQLGRIALREGIDPHCFGHLNHFVLS
jgi:hypothetical protein